MFNNNYFSMFMFSRVEEDIELNDTDNGFKVKKYWELSIMDKTYQNGQNYDV